MTQFHPLSVEHQRKRWMRPDARRFWRWDRRIGLNAHRRLRSELSTRGEETFNKPNDATSAIWSAAAIQREQFELRALKSLAIELRWQIALRRFARKALHPSNYDPNQPRVPAGNGDESGRWTRVAGDVPGIGHNQGPPLDDKPEIPKDKPTSRTKRSAAVKRAARSAWPIALLIAGAEWLKEYRAKLETYKDSPKTLKELQEAVSSESTPGYQDHHINEQTEARKAEFSESLIEGPENLVRIPTMKHEEITGWYMRPNQKFKNELGEEVSPREYLRGQSWEERRRVGLEALIDHGVLKP